MFQTSTLKLKCLIGSELYVQETKLMTEKLTEELACVDGFEVLAFFKFYTILAAHTPFYLSVQASNMSSCSPFGPSVRKS